MTAARCRWCGQVAVDRCRAHGGSRPPIVVDYCGPETECWERTYREVRSYPERTWTAIERRPKRREQPGPDLFDLLPSEESSA